MEVRTDPFGRRQRYPYGNRTCQRFLHAVAHAPLLEHAMASGAALSPARTVVVAGHGADQVACRQPKAFDDEAQVVVQEEQLGTPMPLDRHARPLQGSTGRPSCCTEIRLLCRLKPSKKCVTR